VVIPCYNAADDVAEAVESVVAQSAGERVKEIVLVDDGSEDRTPEVGRALADRHEPVEYVRQTNQGPSVARNRGVRETSQPRIAFLDADDVWHEDKIEKQFAFLERHPEVSLLGSDYYLDQGSDVHRVRVRNVAIGGPDPLRALFLRGGPILMSTVVIDRRCFEGLGGFNPDLRVGQDTDLWLRVAAEHPVHALQHPLVTKRDRSDSVSSDMVRKVKYLRRITDRIVRMYPRLKPLRPKRLAILEGYLVWHWLRKNDAAKARRAVWRALQHDPYAVENYVLLAVTLLPVSARRMRSLLRALGKVHRQVSRQLDAATG
jgi:glycosyltransferase involved in cell wall biosynthesis